ncbi:hypothetical protein D7V97_26610 [Corallococcus sp. CA053C]|uniref:hypothetical protein n=1 Tax=Corallococcus sp. CA053C TaxID=2316732 RepID=UPI000EA08E52|nr:hypothetical protein [Corallococcus sp. CA053C]RKH03385.1 hypothetical protein D7V97_26610 [Corallococcus sp. CA053C]
MFDVRLVGSLLNWQEGHRGCGQPFHLGMPCPPSTCHVCAALLVKPKGPGRPPSHCAAERCRLVVERNRKRE